MQDKILNKIDIADFNAMEVINGDTILIAVGYFLWPTLPTQNFMKSRARVPA
jgi:hypothetical protein